MNVICQISNLNMEIIKKVFLHEVNIMYKKRATNFWLQCQESENTYLMSCNSGEALLKFM